MTLSFFGSMRQSWRHNVMNSLPVLNRCNDISFLLTAPFICGVSLSRAPWQRVNNVCNFSVWAICLCQEGGLSLLSAIWEASPLNWLVLMGGSLSAKKDKTAYVVEIEGAGKVPAWHSQSDTLPLALTQWEWRLISIWRCASGCVGQQRHQPA